MTQIEHRQAFWRPNDVRAAARLRQVPTAGAVGEIGASGSFQCGELQAQAVKVGGRQQCVWVARRAPQDPAVLRPEVGTDQPRDFACQAGKREGHKPQSR